jgi:hypothetical protein
MHSRGEGLQPRSTGLDQKLHLLGLMQLPLPAVNRTQGLERHTGRQPPFKQSTGQIFSQLQAGFGGERQHKLVR